MHSLLCRGARSVLCSGYCRDGRDDKAARNTHGAVGNAEEGEKNIAADQRDKHDGCGIDKCPFGLLTLSLLAHPLGEADEERNFGRRVGNRNERDQTAQKILEMYGFEHDFGPLSRKKRHLLNARRKNVSRAFKLSNSTCKLIPQAE